MNRLFVVRLALCGLLACWSLFALAQWPSAPALSSRAWLLLDARTGQTLAAQRADEVRSPASLTKLMTAYLAFAALQSGRLDAKSAVTPSAATLAVGGARMGLASDRPISIDELLQGLIVHSANDAAIALAETVGGSTDNFVAMMNREAQRLGLNQTRFANPTGFDQAGHQSSAQDLARLAVALQRDFPQAWARFAQRSFNYQGQQLDNRNRLLWLDASVDGLKTGSTAQAGWNIVASARRGERRLIAVVLGASNEAIRLQESLQLLNHGFQAWDTVRLYAAGQTIREIEVWQGASRTTAVGFTEDFVLSVPRDQAGRLSFALETRSPLLAPLPAGTQVATLKIGLDGRSLGDYPLRTLSDTPAAGLLRRAWDGLRLLLN